MKLQLNAKDILNKQFEKDVKGYNPDEVDSFLDKVLTDYRMVEGVMESLKEQIVTLKRENESLRIKIREKDDEISMQKSKNILKNEFKNDSLDNLELLQRCSRYEKKLYQLGVDPSKIK